MKSVLDHAATVRSGLQSKVQRAVAVLLFGAHILLILPSLVRGVSGLVRSVYWLICRLCPLHHRRSSRILLLLINLGWLDVPITVGTSTTAAADGFQTRQAHTAAANHHGEDPESKKPREHNAHYGHDFACLVVHACVPAFERLGGGFHVGFKVPRKNVCGLITQIHCSGKELWFCCVFWHRRRSMVVLMAGDQQRRGKVWVVSGGNASEVAIVARIGIF